MSEATASDTNNNKVPLSLLLILVMALCLRLGWWLAFVDVIDNEGAEYARLAENLMAGHGMTGIFGGRSIMFPPLFPALIGLFSLLTGNVEMAGRIVNLLCGTALVGVLYTLAQHLFNARTAIVVAILAAIHPLLIALSVSTYSEGLWIFLVIGAIYLVVRSLKTHSNTRLALAGFAVGLAYLARPEGIAFFVFLVLSLFAVILLQRSKPVTALQHTGLFLAAGLLVIVPYMIYLSSLGGSFHWEGKSVYNNIQNERLRAGLTVPQAARGLDEQGNPVGVFLNLNLDQAPLLRQSNAGSESLFKTLMTGIVPRAKNIVHQILTLRFLSAPWIFLPIVVGICLTAWWRNHLWDGLIVLGILPIQGILLLSVYQAWDRYFFTLTPLLLLWAGAGLTWTASWIIEHLPQSLKPYSTSLWFSASLLGAISLAATAYGHVRSTGEFEQAGDQVGKQIGERIAADAKARGIIGRPVIMGVTLNSVFYASGTLRYLPAATEAAALTYIRRVQPQYLVVRDFELNQAPYTKEWLERGIPDSCATWLEQHWLLPNDRSRVWRWDCTAQAR